MLERVHQYGAGVSVGVPPGEEVYSRHLCVVVSRAFRRRNTWPALPYGGEESLWIGSARVPSN